MKDRKKFWTAIFIGIAIVVAIALIDIKSALSGVFGSYEDYTNGNYTDGWWGLYSFIVLLLFALAGIIYYYVRRDKSEALAVSLVPYILWRFGWSDVLYFILQGKSIPSTLPWLSESPPYSWVMHWFGVVQVTPTVLICTAIVGAIIAGLVTWVLVNDQKVINKIRSVLL